MEFIINGKALKITDKEKELLRATAKEGTDGLKHRQALAATLQEAWIAGVLEPDLLMGIFDKVILGPGAEAKFPLDLYSPTKESQGLYKAFVVPDIGKIPQQPVEGDEIFVPTYKIANAIDWGLSYARDARWDVITRAMNVYSNGFTQKINDDGWHVILKSATVNSVTNDSAASSGAFTKRLLTDMQTAIKRLTGGRRSKLTDLHMSPEAIADLRNFDNTAVDDLTLRNLLGGGDIPSLFGTKLVEMEELGAGQEYQNYLTNTLGASVATGDREFVVGLDLKNRDSFVMPVREDMKTFDAPELHRDGKAGVYGWMFVGFAALDSRRNILGSF